MTLYDLKEQINKGIFHEDFVIFQCEEDFFVARQYVNAICDFRGVGIHYVDNVFSTKGNLSLVMDYESTEADLNVLITDTFSDCGGNYDLLCNTIVICKKVDKTIQNSVKDFIVKVPKLLDWNIKDYIEQNCPALDKDSVNWLYKASGENIYKIQNEMDKIKLFGNDEQLEIVSKIQNDPDTDLFNMSIFDLTNSILSGDTLTTIFALMFRSCCDFEPLGLVKILQTSYEQALILRGKTSSEDAKTNAGITPKNKGFISRYTGGLSDKQIIKNLEFLTSVDRRLKLGTLEIDRDYFLDYLITNLLIKG